MFHSTHNLDFFVSENPLAFDPNHLMFKVGTCKGVWTSTNDCYVIISLVNSSPGNGHLQDVFEWFENSCKRDNKNLLIVECMNNRFYKHLISKRGFKKLDNEESNCIKVFNQIAYSDLLKNGNEILIKGSLKCI